MILNSYQPTTSTYKNRISYAPNLTRGTCILSISPSDCPILSTFHSQTSSICTTNHSMGFTDSPNNQDALRLMRIVLESTKITSLRYGTVPISPKSHLFTLLTHNNKWSAILLRSSKPILTLLPCLDNNHHFLISYSKKMTEQGSDKPRKNYNNTRTTSIEGSSLNI